MSESDFVVQAEGVQKKFCRSLKRSLYYGMNDMVAEAFGGSRSHDRLRKDEFWAVNNVSFQLRKGECLGLIGHNGAGKTTLLKMLNGLIKPDHGSITMRGRVGALIALGAGFNPILSGRENIFVNGSVLGLTKAEINAKLEDIIDFAEIREFIDAPVQTYSSGMAVRLGFAIAVKCQPDILLLDEVLAVGDVGFQAKCFNTLSEFRKNGTAFILVSHNMHQIARYCDRVIYLKRGQIAHLGDTESAIDAFTRDMDSPDSISLSGATDWSKIYGTGKVVLKAAYFTDQAGNTIDQIRTGDTFSLHIDYECPGVDVSEPIFDILIRDKEGVLFQGTNEVYGVSLGKMHRKSQLKIQFEQFPANGTSVEFFLTILNKKTSEIYDWKRRLKLKVANNPKLTGRVALALTWENTPPP